MLEIEYKGKKVVMYSVEEVAEKIGDTPNIVRKAIRNSEINAVQLGKRYYVLEQNLPEPRSAQKTYTVEEIAEMFGVSSGVVRKAIRGKYFDVVKKGSRVLIPEDSIGYILEEGFGPPGAPKAQFTAAMNELFDITPKKNHAY